MRDVLQFLLLVWKEYLLATTGVDTPEPETWQGVVVLGWHTLHLSHGLQEHPERLFVWASMV